jgi:catechol 2,3-dioxygenase-like lactoylglutathione lyase family enzyme
VRFRLNHVGITVSDLDRAIEFYRDLFELEPGMYIDVRSAGQDESELAREGQRLALLPVGDDALIELIEFTPPRHVSAPVADGITSTYRDVGYAYLSFEVDDLEAEYQRLLDRGARFTVPPWDLGHDRPVQGSRACVLLDPDGKRIELVQYGPDLQTPAINEAAQRRTARPDDPYVLTVDRASSAPQGKVQP